MELIRTEDVTLEDGTRVRIDVATTPEQLLLRAVDDRGQDVGTATCDLTAGPQPHSITVEVPEELRNRGIGTVLFTRLVAAASDRDIEWLTFTGPSDDALLRLAATSGSICARRVQGNMAKSVVLVPSRHAA